MFEGGRGGAKGHLNNAPQDMGSNPVRGGLHMTV